VGGSGKTPLIAALAKEYADAAVVLRGFGRKSRGVQVVSERGRVLCDVECSGDEAMELARALPKASVIVSEDRLQGIAKAKEMGAKVVFLDDAFGKCIEKLDILIDLSTPNPLCLPSGPYRLPRTFLRNADIVVREGRDFRRKVWIENPTQKMVLVTAIANPKRLERFVPSDIPHYYFADHHDFSAEEIAAIWEKESPISLLVTAKDAVKLQKFGYPLSLLRLELAIDDRIRKKVANYIRNYDAKEDPDSPDTP